MVSNLRRSAKEVAATLALDNPWALLLLMAAAAAVLWTWARLHAFQVFEKDAFYVGLACVGAWLVICAIGWEVRRSAESAQDVAGAPRPRGPGDRSVER